MAVVEAIDSHTSCLHSNGRSNTAAVSDNRDENLHARDNNAELAKHSNTGFLQYACVGVAHKIASHHDANHLGANLDDDMAHHANGSIDDRPNQVDLLRIKWKFQVGLQRVKQR